MHYLLIMGTYGTLGGLDSPTFGPVFVLFCEVDLYLIFFLSVEPLRRYSIFSAFTRIDLRDLEISPTIVPK